MKNLRNLILPYAIALASIQNLGLDTEEKPEPFKGKSKEEINKAKGLKEF